MKNTDLQVFTIGHGARKIEAFIDLLQLYKIDIVIDVRSLPYSRFHSQYRQDNLKISLNNIGITYLWLGNELGGRPQDPALYLNGIPNYLAMKETHSFKDGILKILKIVKHDIKVTLMCSESDQNQCHRKNLISDELIKMNVAVIHINKVGDLEEHHTGSNQNLFT